MRDADDADDEAGCAGSFHLGGSLQAALTHGRPEARADAAVLDPFKGCSLLRCQWYGQSARSAALVCMSMCLSI